MFPRYLARGLVLLLSSVLTIWLFRRVFPRPSSTTGKVLHPATTSEVGKSLFLAEEQCLAAFPGLTTEIENAIAEGPFSLRKSRPDLHGLVQGRIQNGKLYIISAPVDNSLHRVPAILHSLHRAIITSPTPLPDTIFALNVNDFPRPNTWSFARSDDDLSPHNPWLMPHYHSWSWAMPALGPLDEVLVKIEQIEKQWPWDKKIDKAVWRGSKVQNPDWSSGLRRSLLDVSKGKQWANIEATGRDVDNTLMGEEFCKYRFIIYAEGKSYSGRLPFHQACSSIILTPPPTFLLHTTHLLRPVFSSLLLAKDGHPMSQWSPPPSSYPHLNTSLTWPSSFPPSMANIVFVAPDWSDLEATILYLRNHIGIAEGIAARQTKMMVGGGYLSEGAEACYWRRLITAWERMVRVEDSNEWGEGMRWETFILLGRTTYDENI